MKEINDLVLSMLEKSLQINTYFDYDGDVFGNNLKEEDRYFQRQDEFEMYLLSTKLEECYRFETRNWYSQSMCLTGLHFRSYIDVFPKDIRDDNMDYPAIIVGGLGDRYLFKALGKRSLVVNAYSKSDAVSDMSYEGVCWEPFRLNSVSIDFKDETLAEQKLILSALEREQERIEKTFLLAELSNNYRSFHKLTGLDSSDFNKQHVPNPKFKELFDEQ